MSSTYSQHSFIFNPLDQFEIHDYFILSMPILNGINISITTITLYLFLAFTLVLLFLVKNSIFLVIIANKWAIVKECTYDTVHSIVKSQINNTYGQIYFPYIYTLFLFIIMNNLLGMIPYSFSSTSHLILAFGLSFTIVIGSTILGFYSHGVHFFSLFVPAGCPLGLLPLLVLIEFISYLSRNISLGLRLGANILSGHMLLNILSGFTYNIMKNKAFFLLGLVPLLVIIAFCGLEVGIALIQAQVFVVLSCSYIKDGLSLHS